MPCRNWRGGLDPHVVSPPGPAHQLAPHASGPITMKVTRSAEAYDHAADDKRTTSCCPRFKASPIQGSSVANASYAGLAQGTARRGLPSARIAIYKACSLGTCHGSIILKAIDDAIKDGVDILSLSLRMNFLLQSDFLKDPIAIGAFHANQMGIMVVSSAGNDGPDPYTVVNTTPWIFTIEASSIDRDFESTVLLGNGFSVKVRSK
ncbi:hypothetical protein Droror1_Dr00023875 [Drosera rotundifolia]